MPSEQTIRFINALSRLLGWSYFISWSISFYPQALLNYSRRSTTGVLLDFPFLNVIGFIFYFLSNAIFFFNPEIRREYAVRNPGSPEPTVRFNDVAFGFHAMILTAVNLSMFSKAIWGFAQDGRRKMASMTVAVAWGCFVGVGVMIAVVLVVGDGDARGWAWIDVIYSFGYAKLAVTFVKYIPQAWANHKRKSTVGWSVDQILLDFAGGILSVSQLFLDSSLQNDWSGVTGNPVKLLLGNVSMLFDIIFMTQHYILYPQRRDGDDPEARGLLRSDSRRTD